MTSLIRRATAVLSLAVVSTAIVTVPAIAETYNTDESLSCTVETLIDMEHLAQLSDPTCTYEKVRILIAGMEFDVPPESVAVRFSARVPAGQMLAPEISVVRYKGEVGVLVDGESFGSAGAVALLRPTEVVSPPTFDPLATYAVKCSATAPYVKQHWVNGKAFHWRYNSTSQPSTSALTFITHGVNAVAIGTSTLCGYLSNGLSIPYDGTTSNAPGVNSSGGCTSMDGISVMGWGAMSTTSLGVTCSWTVPITGALLEADIKSNTNYTWFVASSGCTGTKYDLQSHAAREFGHAVGLGHVGSSSQQVMAPVLPPCNMDDRDLGRGDQRGLVDIYGS